MCDKDTQVLYSTEKRYIEEEYLSSLQNEKMYDEDTTHIQKLSPTSNLYNKNDLFEHQTAILQDIFMI